MAQSRPTRLDAGMFEQALAVLDRERPSPRENRFFRLLNLLVWGAFGLTTLFLVLRLSGFPQGRSSVWIAWGIALIYIVIIPVFISNWPLIKKLWRAARLRRRLAPSFRRRLMDQFSARRRQHRIVNFATFVLSLLGYVVAFPALLGLLFELFPDRNFNPPRLTLYAVATMFGLSCIPLHFMARGRERLEVIAELRSSLLGGRNQANETQLAPADYDELTRIERAQISADRRQSVKAMSDKSLETQYSWKEHRAVRDAKLALAPATLVKVQACIDHLIAHPRADDEATQTRDHISYVRVPETSLEIGFSIDREAREIKVLSLGPANREGTSVGLRQE